MSAKCIVAFLLLVTIVAALVWGDVICVGPGVNTGPAPRAGQDESSLEGVEPRATSLIGASKSSAIGDNARRHASAESVSLESGETTRGDAEMPGGRTLEVQVSEVTTGAPIAGASVWVTLADDHLAGSADVVDANVFTTDKAGIAILSALPEGHLSLMARATDFIERDGKGPDTVGPNESHVAISLKSAHTIRGTVTLIDNVTPESIRVFARRSGHDGQWILQNGSVHAGGLFTIRNLRAGAYAVQAVAKTTTTNYKGRVEAHAGDQDILIPLEVHSERNAFRVHVLDPNGNKVRSGNVEMRWQSNQSQWSVTRPVQNGVATFEIYNAEEEGTLTLMAKDLPKGLGSIAEVSRRALSAGGEITLRVPIGLTTSGRVVGKKGKGVAGIHVAALPIGRGTSLTSASAATATTDSSGAFVLRGLGAGPYYLAVKGNDRWFAPRRRPIFQAGADDVPLVMVEALSFEIRVVSETGMPVKNAHVGAATRGRAGAKMRLSKQERNQPQARPKAQPTDDTGMTRLLAVQPDTKVRLWIRPSKDDQDRYAALVIEEWEPKDATIPLLKAQTIRGRVIDLQDRPIQSGVVSAILDGGHYSTGANIQHDGTFEIKSIKKGLYLLSVSLSGSNRTHKIHGVTRDELGLRVESGATNVVLRIDAGDATEFTFPGIDEHWTQNDPPMVILTKRGQKKHMLMAPIKGTKFISYGLEPDQSYVVAIYDIPGGRYYLQQGVKSGDRIDIAARQGESIQGTVNPVKGLSFKRVRVAIELPSGHAYTRVDAQGNFEFSGIPPGAWTIYAHAISDQGVFNGRARAATGTSVSVSLTK